MTVSKYIVENTKEDKKLNKKLKENYNKQKKELIRTFDSGATRNLDNDKYNYEGFLSPLVIERYAKYMHSHRLQADGTMRDADNWQKGIDYKSYMESLWRHFMDVWKGYRKNKLDEEAICAAIFNLSGMLHEYLKKKDNIDNNVNNKT